MAAAVLQQARESLRLQRLERLRIAEKGGDADENVLIQRLDFGRIALQEAGVFAAARQLEQRHPAADAPVQRVGLILREVDTGILAQCREDLVDLLQVRCLFPAVPDATLEQIRKTGDPRQLARDRGRRQHEIDPARGNGAARHAVVERRGILRYGDATRRPVGSESHGAVVCGA